MRADTPTRTTGRLGRSPRHASAILAAVAALALAGAGNPSHAQTRVTIWSATLGVDLADDSHAGKEVRGCGGLVDLRSCTRNSAWGLTDRTFDYAGVSYTITDLYRIGSPGGGLHLALGTLGTALGSDARFEIGGQSFEFSARTAVTGLAPGWTGDSFAAWSHSQAVPVSITVTEAKWRARHMITGFRVSGARSPPWKAQLRWNAIKGVTSYEYRSKSHPTGACPTAGSSYGSWKRAGAGTATGIDVALPTTERRCFQLRASGAGTTGKPSTPVLLDEAFPNFTRGVQLRAEPRYKAVKLSWNPLHGLTGYEYQYGKRTGSACTTTTRYGGWTLVPDDESIASPRRFERDVSGLINGTAYCFRIRPKVGTSSGPNSDPVEATPSNVWLVTNPDTSRASPMQIVEGGVGYYTLQLSHRPTGKVGVRLYVQSCGGSGPEAFGVDATDGVLARGVPGTYNGPHLRFTPANWNQPRRISVRALEDGPFSGFELDDCIHVVHDTRSGDTADPRYAEKTRSSNEDTWFTSYDNDIPGRVFGLRVDPNPVREGEQFTVSLTRLASDGARRNIGLSTNTGERYGTAELGDYVNVDCGGLVFAAGQRTATCTYRAAHDEDTDDEAFTIALAPLPAGVGPYEGNPARVTILDDDLPVTEPPGRPRGVEAEAGDRQVRLRWDAMDRVSGWQVEKKDGVWTHIGVAGATSHMVTGLANGVTYRFRVRAMNAMGLGAPSTPVSATPAPERVPTPQCTERIAGDGSVTGRWAGRCFSLARAGHYAQWYELTLAERRSVTIELRARADAYLYLRAGAGRRSGAAIEENDDGGGGHNSRIGRTLDAGTYTIEATTYGRGETGDFTLTVSGTGDAGGTGGGTSEEPGDDGTTPPPPAEPALRVSDARADEGDPYDSGVMRFTVTLSPAAEQQVTVNYETRDGTARGDPHGLHGDYQETAGVLSFAPGETSKTAEVLLIGDWHDEGDETFYLVLSNPWRAIIADGEGVGTIVNDGPIPKAWLARFGRAAASDAIAAVSERLRTPRDAGSHLTLGGQRLERFGGGSGELAGAARGERWRSKAGAAHGTDRDARTMSARELLMGTSFRAVLGTGAGSQWTGWGQGASVSGFSSAGPGLSLSGETATGSMGMDWERGRLLAGFAMTHSLGEGTAHGAGRRYVMGSAVTTMLPYARYALSERISAWGLAGTGSGSLTLDLDGGAPERYGADLAMSLAAVGVRGDLVTPAEAGGFALALEADGFWARTESDAVSAPGVGNLAGARADASRLRAVLDGSRTFSLAGGATLRPSVALGLRHDGGDAETGTGLELGAGLGYADPSRGLDMALRVHGLAAHAGDGYSEWGVSGSLRLEPGGSGSGLSASLVPSFGADPGGAQRLWTLPDASGLAANGDAPLSSRLDAEVGYGMAVFGGGFTGTPNVGFGLSDTAHEVRMGWRLTPAGADAGGFELNLDAARRDRAGETPEHRIGLGIAARW